MKSRRYLFAVLLAFVLLAVGVVSGLAQTGPQPSDDEVNAVAKELYCPVCENIPLDVCPTQACAQWRDLIREKLAGGWNKEQIKNYFKDKVYQTVIPRNIRLSEAPSHGKPINRYDSTSIGARKYAELASELLKNNGASGPAMPPVAVQ